MDDSNADELYRRYRPLNFDEVIGQDEIVEMLENMIEQGHVPHCILATGPSGCGKTTTFRILKDLLNCSEIDYREQNAADVRGIDAIRDIRQKMQLAPMSGDVKIYLIDEAHQLTSEAQEALLKMLEDTPKHVYFFLASTDPRKIKRTIITRSTQLAFRALTNDELIVLVTDVFKKERNEKLPGLIASKIAELAEGSARKALVVLQQIIHKDVSDEDAVLDSLQSVDAEREVIELCRALLKNAQWQEIADIIKGLKDPDPEKIRKAVLGYMNTVLLAGGKPAGRASDLIEIFRDNLFDAGMPGLTNYCFRSL